MEGSIEKDIADSIVDLKISSTDASTGQDGRDEDEDDVSPKGDDFPQAGMTRSCSEHNTAACMAALARLGFTNRNLMLTLDGWKWQIDGFEDSQQRSDIIRKRYGFRRGMTAKKILGHILKDNKLYFKVVYHESEKPEIVPSDMVFKYATRMALDKLLNDIIAFPPGQFDELPLSQIFDNESGNGFLNGMVAKAVVDIYKSGSNMAFLIMWEGPLHFEWVDASVAIFHIPKKVCEYLEAIVIFGV